MRPVDGFELWEVDAAAVCEAAEFEDDACETVGLTEEAKVVGAGALLCAVRVTDRAREDVRAGVVACADVRAGELGIAVGIGSAMLSLEKKEAATPPRLFRKLPSCLRSGLRLR
jgi:hypothetical protein